MELAERMGNPYQCGAEALQAVSRVADLPRGSELSIIPAQLHGRWRSSRIWGSFVGCRKRNLSRQGCIQATLILESSHFDSHSRMACLTLQELQKKVHLTQSQRTQKVPRTRCKGTGTVETILVAFSFPHRGSISEGVLIAVPLTAGGLNTRLGKA